MAGTVYGYNTPERLRPQGNMAFKGPTPENTQNPQQAQWDDLMRAGNLTRDALSYSTDTMGVTPFGAMYSPGSPAGSMPPSISALSGGRTAGGSSSESMASAGPSYQEQWAREDQLRREKLDTIKGLIPSDSARVRRTPEDTAKEEAARSAAFARAKETAGLNARASMSALNEMSADRGLTGSSMEAAQGGRIIGGAGSQVNDFLRDQAMSEADRASEISDMEYQGQVAQRGQEMARKQAILSLLGGLY